MIVQAEASTDPYRCCPLCGGGKISKEFEKTFYGTDISWDRPTT